MHRSFVAELAARRATIKQSWERKLRHEPVTSPLANPDTLILLMDHTLDDLGAALAQRCRTPAPESGTNRLPRGIGCVCGLNPLLAYFRVAASVLPTVMAAGADHCSELDAAAYAGCLQEMQAELHGLAAEEIRDFCATCQTEIARGGRAVPAAHVVVGAAAR